MCFRCKHHECINIFNELQHCVCYICKEKEELEKLAQAQKPAPLTQKHNNLTGK